jgi:membrane protein DedA with SNARE-associated domain
VGYFFGRHWDRLEREIKRLDLAAAVALLLIAAFLWWRNRRAKNGASSE